MREVKQIIFDFGNVLFDINLPAIWKGFELLMPPGAIEPFVQKLHAQHILQGYEIGGLTTAEFLEQVSSAALPYEISGKQVESIWNSIFIGMPAHRFDMLLALRKRYKVYLLSNVNDLHLRYIENYLASTHGITNFEQDYFDGVYYSHLVRMRKPDDEIYQYLITDAQIDVAETMFFDDLPENIAAAKQLGIKSYLHDPQREIVEHIHAVGLV